MARSLVQSKIAKELREANGGKPKDDALLPGHMRLYSFYKPSLQASLYSIEATQSIWETKNGEKLLPPLKRFNTTTERGTSHDDLAPILPQNFAVIAPQFSLDPKLINTYYPPSGHQDEGRILPHIVFNDPHVPWFREAGISKWMTGAVDTEAPGSDLEPDPHGRNLLPWLALLVFEPDDLLVGLDDATSLGLAGLGVKTYDPTKLPGDGAFVMTVGQYLNPLNIKSRVYYDAGYQGAGAADFEKLKQSTEPMSAIFPNKSKLQEIFTANKGRIIPVQPKTASTDTSPTSSTVSGATPTVDVTSATTTPAGESSPTTPEGTIADLVPLQAQKLLSHVRHINTMGFPDAGVEEEGYYSVVVSSMTGNIMETTATTHIVHLVSLEHIDATLTDPKSAFFSSSNSERIGLVSLFSWTYTCIPEAVSFKDTMENLGIARQPLMPPKETLEGIKPKPVTITANPSDEKNILQNKINQALYDRLRSGYTMSRWRTATGEESVAFNRGPLVPLQPQEVPLSQTQDKPNRFWPALSMTGKDYTVFDNTVGAMDVTYSSAWSLGKLMAISDSVFNAALMRFRSTVWSEAASVTRMFINNIPSTTTVLQKSATAIGQASQIIGDTFTGQASRINIPSNQQTNPSVEDPKITKIFREAIDKAMNQCASAGGKALYNGFDGVGGNNSDWEVILNWIHNVMYLATIPAHVLLPEPSHLQSFNKSKKQADKFTSFYPEALRFFYIDHAWIDCFLDGALSCANHLEPDFDYTRLRIKAIFNFYLQTPIANTQIQPPVPRYGFILRSAVVKSTPDLRLTVTCWKLNKKDDGTTEWIEDPKRDPLVRHTRMDEFTMLCLVDCTPEEICKIKFAQPPHQQRFAVDCKINKDDATQMVTSVMPDIQLMQLFTDKDQAPALPNDLEWKALPTLNQLGGAVQTTFYDKNTRRIEPIKIAKAANDQVLEWAKGSDFKNKPPYDDKVPNSCVLGLQLNDPSYELRIEGYMPTEKKEFPSWSRQLWVGKMDPSAFVPRSRRIKPSDIKSDQPPKVPTTVPHKIIKIPPHNPNMKIDPHKPPSFSRTRVVPRDTFIGKTREPDPFIATPNAMFELLVHPDYRPPPPRPHPDSDGHLDGGIFSPLDYIPTKTNSLYDLIFAVRRRDNLNRNRNLQYITIEIPVSDNGDKQDPRTGSIREPLLEAADYAGASVSMCSNQRFVPDLYSGSASSVGSALWDGKAVLGITLIPKSGLQTGTMPLLPDGKAAEASVRLTEARIMPVVDTTTTAMIAKGTDPKTGRTVTQQLHRGLCLIRMTEHYGDDVADEWSWCMALKVDSGDKDPWEHKI